MNTKVKLPLAIAIRASGVALSYVTLVVVSRNFGLQGTGTFGYINSIWNTAALVGALGLNSSMTQVFAKDEIVGKGLGASTFFLLLAIACLASVILVFSISWIKSDIFDFNGLSLFAQSTAAVPCLAIWLIVVGTLKAVNKPLYSEILSTLAKPVLVLSAMLIFQPISDLSNLLFGAAIFLGFTSLILALKAGKIINFSRRKTVRINEVLESSYPMLLSSIASIAMGQGLIWIYTLSSPSAQETGVLTISIRIAQLLSILLVATNTFLAPKLADCFWNNRIKDLQNLVDRVMCRIWILSIIGSILILCSLDLIMKIFDHELSFSDKIVLTILVGTQLVNNLSGPASLTLNLVGGEKSLRRVSYWACLFSLSGYALGVFAGRPFIIIIGYAIGLNFLNIRAAKVCRRDYGIRTFPKLFAS